MTRRAVSLILWPLGVMTSVIVVTAVLTGAATALAAVVVFGMIQEARRG